jgi:FkbM family methyltransferase
MLMSDPSVASGASAEDLPFQHYSLKHKVIAWVSGRLFDNVTYTVHHGLLKGMRRKGGLGWLPAAFSPGIETAEHKFWEELDLNGKTVYDVGSFHGLLALFFASRAKQVVCFEPNTQNNKRLTENLALNGIKNVQVRKVGVGSKAEVLKMVVDPLMPGGSSVDGKMKDQILQSGVATVSEEISITTLDEEIPKAQLPPPDFIKIDIEGWELEALRGARQTLQTYKPTIFLEMHGDTMREKKRKVADIVSFLWEIDYRHILHIESGKLITPETSAVAMEGHLYCSYSAVTN